MAATCEVFSAFRQLSLFPAGNRTLCTVRTITTDFHKPIASCLAGSARNAFSFVRSARELSSSAVRLSEPEEVEGGDEKKSQVDPSKDRSKPVPPEVSIRYMNSQAYKITYGDDPVWKKYRRNFKGQFPPKLTRRSCVRKGMIDTGSPCPICRDEYLVPDYRNVKLLKQFINPFTGEIYPTVKTGVCRKQQTNIVVSVIKAKDYGFITHDVPFREYNYEEYYPQLKTSDKSARE